MTQSAITSITPGQKKQYARFVEDAAERALIEVGLDKDGLQKLIMRGGEFQARLIAAIREFSVSNQFADEEVASSYAYPSGYTGARFITEQTNRLRQLFIGVGFANEKLVEQQLPSIMEGYFAIPRWGTLASTYNEAVEMVLARLKGTRPFYNYREGQLGPDRLRQSEHSIAMWQKLAEQQQGHDILVVPAQFGLRHRGRSVRRAREMFQPNEFGLGAYATGIMHLTHPERLVSYDDLWPDCAGDEYAPEADGSFVHAPRWNFYDGKLRFGTRDVASYFGYDGSASAVLPE